MGTSYVQGNAGPDGNINSDENICIDINVPLPISKKATLQGALAIDLGTEAGNPYEPKRAFSLKARKLQLGNITLVGDLIAVEPGCYCDSAQERLKRRL